jgi:dethiobiotin synthase
LIPGIFIAGTGTDVGKTVVTAGVLRFLLRHIFAGPSAVTPSAMVMKPVQTGCQLGDGGRMIAPDIDFVLRAAKLSVDQETLAHLSPYLFQPACSPHLAASMAGARIEIDRILASAQWLALRHQRLVVESAGGVAVPLNESETMLDLAWRLQMPLLLVGHSGLGTINHVLLSLEAIRRRGCPLLGVILNDIGPVPASDRFIHEDNVRTIESFGKVTAVTRIPYLGHPPNLEQLDSSLDRCDFLKEYRL